MPKIIDLDERRKKIKNDSVDSAGLTLNHPRSKIFLNIIKDTRSQTLPPKILTKIAKKLAGAFSPPISDPETNLCVYHEIQKKTLPPYKNKADPGLTLFNVEKGIQDKLLTRGDAQEIIKTIKIWHKVDLPADNQ